MNEMNVKENRISNWILGLYWIFIYLDSAARNFSQMVKTNDRAQAEKKEKKTYSEDKKTPE